MTSERQFIRQLQQHFAVKSPVEVGIGDDGAVLNSSDHQQQVVVTDMLLDQVHFDLNTNSPGLAGRKAIAVNLSDLAAMACFPTAAFVSIAVPRSLESPDEFLDQLYGGMAKLAEEHRFTIAGGDTNFWDGPFAINVCLTGVPMQAKAVLRSGAQPGDTLFVTGALGGSLASGRHLNFTPRLYESLWLAENVEVSAMIDISDGLSIDLHRMMEASGTGALLYEDLIPIHADVKSSLSQAERLHAALSDGEDFELLIAMREPEKLYSALIDFHRIGAVTDATGRVELEDSVGSRSIVPETGWQHS